MAKKVASNLITIVSHDAGGAEILSNYVLKNKENYQFVLDGPAISIFKKLLGNIQLISLEESLVHSDTYLTGTSWQSDLEKKAISIAKQKCIRVVSFLDHWVNYKERFLFDGKLNLPDEIWVGDKDALSIANRHFPGAVIFLKENPYFESVKKYFKTQIAKRIDIDVPNPNVLFLCENISDHAKKAYNDERYWGYTEEDAIRFFFTNLKKLKIEPRKVVFRPHPSDKVDKYHWILDSYKNFTIHISNTDTLFEQIALADLVVGCESMALIIALLAGKKVVSCIPPGGKKLELPQVEILELRNL